MSEIVYEYDEGCCFNARRDGCAARDITSRQRRERTLAPSHDDSGAGKDWAIFRCPGWDDQGGSDALGQRRCVCGWSWYAHRTYGRPHPPEPPLDYDTDDPEWIARWVIDEDE